MRRQSPGLSAQGLMSMQLVDLTHEYAAVSPLSVLLTRDISAHAVLGA